MNPEELLAKIQTPNTTKTFEMADQIFPVQTNVMKELNSTSNKSGVEEANGKLSDILKKFSL